MQKYNIKNRLKNIIITILAALGLVAVVYNLYNVKEPRPKFHPNLGATIMDEQTFQAAKHYQSIRDCNKSGNEDDYTIDWSKLGDYGIANVCLFYMFEKLEGPREVENWLSKEKFELYGPEEYIGGSTTMKFFGYGPEEKVVRISALWFLENKPRKFIDKSFLNLGTHAQSIIIDWFPDGRLKSVKSLSINN